MLNLYATKKQIDIGGFAMFPRTELIGVFSNMDELSMFITGKLFTSMVMHEPSIDYLYDGHAIVAEGRIPESKIIQPFYSGADIFVVDTRIDIKQIRLAQIDTMSIEELKELAKNNLL